MNIFKGVGKIGAGLFGGFSSREAYKEAMEDLEAGRENLQTTMGDHIGAGREFADFGRGEYEKWSGRGDRAYQDMREAADANRSVDYARIAADNRAAVDSARQQASQQMQRYGINPGDGQWGANEREYGLGSVLSEVGARDNARRALRNERYSKLQDVFGVTAGMSEMGAGMAQQGYGVLSNAYESNRLGWTTMINEASDRYSEAKTDFQDSIAMVGDGIGDLLPGDD